jgi:hypothetical protein
MITRFLGNKARKYVLHWRLWARHSKCLFLCRGSSFPEAEVFGSEIKNECLLYIIVLVNVHTCLYLDISIQEADKYMGS